MAIIGPRYRSSLFDYDAKREMFSQEASVLQGGMRVSFLGSLYDDACDVGMVIVSDRTGKEVPFYLSDTVVSKEGEVLEWKLRSASNDPSLESLVVVVLND